MSELIPKDLPDGKELVQEGVQIGNTFEAGKGAFRRYRQVNSDNQFKLKQIENGFINYRVELGLSTVQEQVEALKHLWDLGRKKGVEVNLVLSICSLLSGLPPELRSKAPKPTSFVFESLEDFIKIAEAAPTAMYVGDHMLCSPYSVSNTINCIKAGACTIGVVSQYVWDYPYFHDDVAQTMEVVKALGIMASKRKDGFVVGSYTGDGMPGQLLDNVSVAGYTLFEKYVVERLCGAAYSTSFGGLHGNVPVKMAIWLALHDVLSEDHPSHVPVTNMEGNTIDVTEDLETNYAIAIAEAIPYIILERKYRTGTSFTPKPITEAIRVPTLDEIIDIIAVCRVAERKALEYEKADMLDESYINKLRITIATNGKKFYDNMIEGLLEMGIDITDPLQMLLATRRLGGKRVEELFHPGEKDPSRPRGIVPYVATDLEIRARNELEQNIEIIRAEKLGDAIKGKKIVIGSADTHEYGLFVLGGVLRAFGAQVVDRGVDLDPEQVLDAAFEEDTPYIAISTHNGQCLHWGRRILEVAKKRNQNVKVAMGGTLNAMLPGNTEPVDVSDRLSELGIIPCHDVLDFSREVSRL